ncbi:MAG TPA: hypothetical protein VI454_03730 [Verrucomicrobiae bacterium]
MIHSALAAVLFAGCASIGTPGERGVRAITLREQLLQLGPDVDRNEASRLADSAVEQAAELAHDYHPAQPAWFNNILVNFGLRDRGLCFHWTNDLFKRLHRLELRSLELHLAVSRRGESAEHNAVVVTARGQPFHEGVVLDAWRNGGRLWWSRVADDPKHPWRPLPSDAVPKELRPLLSQ